MGQHDAEIKNAMADTEQKIERLRRRRGSEAGGPLAEISNQATGRLFSIVSANLDWLRRSGEERPLISILLAFEIGLAVGRWGADVRSVILLKIAAEAEVLRYRCMAARAASARLRFIDLSSVQNILLATRALGLGTTLTTLYLIHEKEAEAAMGIPETQHSYAILPIGYPLGNFGPVRRAPLSEVVYDDRWGASWTME
jgi:nitroreductase